MKYCDECGAQLDDRAEFCDECGAKLGERVEEQPVSTDECAAGQNGRQTGASGIAAPKPEKKGHKAMAVMVGILVLAVLAGGIWFAVSSGKKDRNDAGNSTKTAAKQEKEEDKEKTQKKDEKEEASQTPEPTPEVQVSAEPEPTPEVQAVYILPESNSRYLTDADLSQLTKDQLRLARNEIYARYGRLFQDEALQNYFNSCSWYQGTIPADSFDESMLNEFEKANRDLIQKYENGTAGISYSTAYSMVLDNCAVLLDDPQYYDYALYDINKDGILELFVYTGTCDADAAYEIYTTDSQNNASYIGSTFGAVILYAMDDPGQPGVLAVKGHMGYETVLQIMIQGGKAVSNELFSREAEGYTDYKHPLSTCPLNDFSLLKAADNAGFTGMQY